MRNLKKFLALVLAMMMTLSLMVTVNAADTKYGDMDEIIAEFQDDITVLDGMGIIRGWDDEFHPKDIVTRAQMAAFIYRLKTGDYSDRQDNLYVNVSSEFEDVQTTDWYAGYIGYCADAGIMQGWDNKAHPDLPVTGYQALTMILRAMGANEPGHNFSGGNFGVEAASMATTLGMLTTVNKSTYAHSLSADATRELVAELTFQGATTAQLQWTNAFGYQQYGMIGGVLGSVKNPTLGEQNYGLTNTTRIVLGNQATGEKGTLLGADKDGTASYIKTGDTTATLVPYTMYSYPGIALTSDGNNGIEATVPNGVMLDYESDLGLYGHKVNVWYNANQTPSKVYAINDLATISTVVEAASSDIDGTNATDLGAVAGGAGFDMSATSGYYYSLSFGRFNAGGGGSTAYGFGPKNAMTVDPTAASNPDSIWYVVSNSEDETLDVVVAVETVAAQIAQINNSQTPKTVTLGAYNGGTFGGATLLGLSTGLVNQSSVLNPEAIKLGNRVVATSVNKTTAATTGTYGIWLDTITKTDKGTVVAWDDTNKVVSLADGRTLNQSILWDASAVTLGTFTQPSGASYYSYRSYIFTVDMQGNVLAARPDTEVTFVYGTFVDQGTELGTSKMNYRLIGVDMEGKPVNEAFDTLDISGAVTVAPEIDISDLTIPYRENSSGQNSIRTGSGYSGFTVGGGLVSNDRTGTGMNNPTMTGATTYGATQAGVGAVQVTDANADGSTPAKAKVYLTEKTQFYVVSGYGTDSLTIEPYTGITALLGNNASVSIDNTNVTNMYYSLSDYTYGTTGATSKQVDVMFIPKSEITWTGGSSLFFSAYTAASNVSEPTSGGTPALLYTLYNNGEKVNVWVKDSPTNAPSSAGFYELTPMTGTGNKTVTGEQKYDTKNATGVGTPGITGVVAATGTYTPDTNNGFTATLGSTLINVANAKVIDCVPSATPGYPFTLNSLADLNALASVKTVTVCVQMAEPGSLTASYIYVTNVA